MKLFYDIEGREFYMVSERPKSFLIEWVKNTSCGEELDQGVDFKKLVVKKDNKGPHCLRDYDDNELLVYPFRGGQPFYLKKATLENIEKEIQDCDKWGVSTEYYLELKKQL